MEMSEEAKIYVGNLEFGITDETLKQTIEEKGFNPKDVKIIKDKFSGRSKGFGFVEFENEDQAQAAIENLNGFEVSGRPLRVNKAQKMKPRGNDFRGNRPRQY
jgi:RNA recognition motif-containing protein